MPAPTWLRRAALALALAAAILPVAFACARLGAASVWDDAYMFVRYADRLRLDGRLAFEPGGPATYGLTSPSFLLFGIPARALAPGHAARAAAGASAAAAVLALVALAVLVWRAFPGRPTARAAALAFAAFALAFAADPLSAHAVSGMDTCWAIAWLAIVLAAFDDFETRTGARADAARALLAGLTFAVRPDALLITLGLPVALAVGAPDAGARTRAVRVAALALGVVALQMGAAARVLHSPVPLAFFAKSAGLYGARFAARYRPIAWDALARFARSELGLLGAIALAALASGVRAARAPRASERALAIATLAFVLYETFGVVQVMYYRERFLQPALPALVLLGTRSAVALADAARRRAGPRAVAIAGLVVAVLAVASLARPLRTLARTRPPAGDRFDLTAVYRDRWRHYWAGLDRVSALDPRLSIATTEVGMPLALSPGRRIVDLAGLNQTALATRAATLEDVLSADPVDLVYEPHPDYDGLRAQLDHSAWYARAYERHPAAAIGADMGVAILRSSPWADTLRAIVTSPR